MITLHHPPVTDLKGNLSKNPIADFDPQNPTHYPKGPGIYIYGIRVEVNNEKKFVPLCVGESIDLSKRLYSDHYTGKFVTNFNNLTTNTPKKIKENKEIWDFSKKTMSVLDILKIYSDMRMYIAMSAGKNRTSQEFMKKLNQLKTLIYFQNKNFFNFRYNYPHQVSHENISAYEASKLFPASNKQITDTLANFVSNFYFVYADHIDTNKASLSERGDRLNIEVKLNQELINRFDIYTTADKSRKGNDFDVDFDFSLIEKQIIHLI